MALQIKEFDQMVDDTITRIIDSGIGITNASPGSVVRTLVEAILPEIDVLNYNTMQAYASKTIDNAIGEDLDDIAGIFGTTRFSATYSTGTVTFSTTEASDQDISIEYNQIISTRQSPNGDFLEVMITDEDAVLLAGQTSITVNVRCVTPGNIYIPSGALVVMSTPIIGISDVVNDTPITGGSDIESDDELRIRVKGAWDRLGKGTSAALKTSLEELEDVTDVMVIDMIDGIGTVGVVVVTDIIPPPTDVDELIRATIASTKSAGIRVDIVYPTIVYVNVSVQTTVGEVDVIGKTIVDYINTLGISDSFIINQMERRVLSAIIYDDADITTLSPTSNVMISGTQVIKSGTITVNGVIYNA